MKKLAKTATAILIALLLSLIIINQLVMRSIKTEIVIDAPVETVWNILMDHEAYPSWNPFIKQISGPTQVGEILAVRVQSEGNSPMAFRPLVLANQENQEFRWVGKLMVRGIFDGEHYFLLEQTAPNQTRFIQGENFTGILSGLFMKMIRVDTEGGFRAMNEALKHRAEN